jgi:hypothetical protein
MHGGAKMALKKTPSSPIISPYLDRDEFKMKPSRTHSSPAKRVSPYSAAGDGFPAADRDLAQPNSSPSRMRSLHTLANAASALSLVTPPASLPRDAEGKDHASQDNAVGLHPSKLSADPSGRIHESDRMWRPWS